MGTSVFPHTYGLIINQGGGEGVDTARKSSFCSSIIGFGSRVFSDFSGGREEGSRIRAVWNFSKEIVREFRRDLDFGFSIFNADFRKEKLECDEISFEISRLWIRTLILERWNAMKLVVLGILLRYRAEWLELLDVF